MGLKRQVKNMFMGLVTTAATTAGSCSAGAERYALPRGTVVTSVLVVLALTVSSASTALADDFPNIVYILADDLGYGDVRCLNPESKIPTPHMDRLAAEGMTFTDAHSGSAVCTPTRYGILTGRYAWRSRLKKHVLYGYAPPLIESGERTVAHFLKEQGYRTACIGKWHLGLGWQTSDGTALNDDTTLTGENIDFARPFTGGPVTLGFDYFFGISASLDMPPYVYLENDRAMAIPRLMKPTTFRVGLTAEGFETVDVLPQLAERAVAWLREQQDAERERPFFLYLPLTSPHTPVVPLPELKGASRAGDYGDFVVQTDAVVGQVLAALEQLGLANNTLVIVTSDNGSTEPTEKMVTTYGHRPNYHFRGRKSDAWEGGHRVPFIVRWPARIAPGSNSTETICHTDLFATVADLIDMPLPDDAAGDSVSMLPALLGEKTPAPLRAFTVHHSIDGTFALRQGPWKLIDAPGSGGWSSQGENAPPADGPPVQLYHLERDPGEALNLWAEEPARVAAMKALLEGAKAGTTPQTPGS